MTNTIYWTTRGAVGTRPATYHGRFVIAWRHTAAGWRIARFLVQPNPPPRR